MQKRYTTLDLTVACTLTMMAIQFVSNLANKREQKEVHVDGFTKGYWNGREQEKLAQAEAANQK
jgi:hypothetical protein